MYQRLTVCMEFGIAIKNLNQILKEKKPVKFNSSWIEANALSIYKFDLLHKHRRQMHQTQF